MQYCTRVRPPGLVEVLGGHGHPGVEVGGDGLRLPGGLHEVLREAARRQRGAHLRRLG